MTGTCGGKTGLRARPEKFALDVGKGALAVFTGAQSLFSLPHLHRFSFLSISRPLYAPYDVFMPYAPSFILSLPILLVLDSPRSRHTLYNTNTYAAARCP